MTTGSGKAKFLARRSGFEIQEGLQYEMPKQEEVDLRFRKAYSMW
jgi:hypothetical protein